MIICFFFQLVSKGSSCRFLFFFFGLGMEGNGGGRVKAKFMMDIKWGFFFFSYRMNILVR